MRLPSLNALRAFEAVSRHLNFRKAAEELHVTKGAVSQQIKLLEGDIGIALVRRSNQGLTLTEAGQSALKELRGGFEQLAVAAQKMREAGSSRLLMVSAPPSFSAMWLVARLERFKRAYPEIDVLLDTTNSAVDLEHGNLHAAISFSTGHFPDMHAVRLFDEHVFPVCSPALLAGPHPLRSLADLRHHTLLHLEWTPTECKWPDWQAWLMAAGASDVDHTRGPRFTWHAMALQAAVQGQGVALASTPIVNDDLAAGRLVCPFDRSISTRFGYYLVCLPELAATRKIQAFREWLLREAEISVGERGLAGDPGAEAAPPARAANLA